MNDRKLMEQEKCVNHGTEMTFLCLECLDDESKQLQNQLAQAKRLLREVMESSSAVAGKPELLVGDLLRWSNAVKAALKFLDDGGG